MTIDATFWVAIAFIIFIAILVYLKVPQKINSLLNIMIEDIKNELNEAEKLKKESKNLLNESQEKLENAQKEQKELNESMEESFRQRDERTSREELSETARKPIGKSLWDIGVDVVSGEALSLLLTSLSPGGAVACSGLVGGPSFESSIFPFILRGNALIGIDSVEIPLKTKEHIWEHFAGDWALDGLEAITKEVSLDNLETEITSILNGNQVGRVLVKI